MAFKLNHLHLKSPDPKKTADFYVDNLGATLVSEVGGGRGFRLGPPRSAFEHYRHDRLPEPRAEPGN